MKLKIFNLLKKSVASKAAMQNNEDFLIAGHKDNEPLLLAEMLYNSNIGNACIETFTDFVRGSDVVGCELTLNRQGEKLSDLHKKWSRDYVTFGGFYILVKYNSLYEISEMYHLPYEFCRLGKPDDSGYINKIYFNPYFGTVDYSRSKEHTKVYDTYNSNEDVIQAQMIGEPDTYKGQVLFISLERPLSRLYPTPYWDSCRDWMKVDYKIGMFHERNIDNNFLLSVMIKMIGDPDAAIETNSNGQVIETVGDAFNRQMESEFSGAENGGKVFVTWSKQKDEFPEISAFPTSSNHELFNSIQQIVVDQITVGTRVNPIIAGIQVAGKLGNSQEIINAQQLMNNKASEFQSVLQATYNMLMKNFAIPCGEIVIKRLSPVSLIPSEYLNVLTNEEKRAFIEKNFDIELIENGVQVSTNIGTGLQE